MVINKKAQFFLLAAVIIVTVITSLGITANQARVTKEPENFYDFSYEVNREIGAVVDYSIYSDFDDEVDLTDFVNLLTDDIKDKNPDADFVIIYGDNISGVIVINEKKESIAVGDKTIEGREEIKISKICQGYGDSRLCKPVENFNNEIKSQKIDAEELAGQSVIQVEIGVQAIDFPVSQHKQVLFIIQKDVGDERFVAIK